MNKVKVFKIRGKVRKEVIVNMERWFYLKSVCWEVVVNNIVARELVGRINIRYGWK